ncbi:hypothetical protein F511_30367 [Dorcoceras hygrometricum]|uniref:Uncharacterized protein n=1 Tax=Dorcoceras hygrometricum TaxID=472368 RepID=A0A2Z7BSS6_9LAMI|nr:hypothetical protein F511_30367 [Dorcoceras hygrometricum]
MSLFDLQDVCIAIGSIATLDLPMVVDPIGIYGLKGPYSGQITHCPSYTFRIDLNKACDHNQLSSESKNQNLDPAIGPPPCAAAPSSRAHERAQLARWLRKGGERWPQLRARRPALDARRWAGRAQAVAQVAGRCFLDAPLRLAIDGRTIWRACSVIGVRRWRPLDAAVRRLLALFLRVSRSMCATFGARWRMERRACRGRAALCRARFLFGGGRLPAAAPAKLRRCRDGWSEFF